MLLLIISQNLAKIKAIALYIINFVEIAYHPLEEWHIIKSQERYTLKRDDIQ